MATTQQKREPSIKQRKVFRKVMIEGKPIGQAMREAGYSLQTSRVPQAVTRSKTWKQLLDEYLPDDLLASVARDGLHATKKAASGQVEADHLVRHKYLETGLKVKGKLAGDTSKNNVFIITRGSDSVIDATPVALNREAQAEETEESET